MKESKVCRPEFKPGILSPPPGFSVFLLLLFLILLPLHLSAQEEDEYYEISVNIEIQRIGGTEVEAVIKGKELYLAITDLFDFLKIRNIPSADLESVSGFFINADNAYLIDRSNNRIHYNEIYCL